MSRIGRPGTAARGQPSAIVLVAHGSAADGTAGASVELLADRLRTRPDAGPVEAAFLHGPSSLPIALKRLSGEPEVRIVPLFSAEGYYTSSVIPAAIAAASALRPRQTLRQLPPIGVVPGYVSLLARRLRQLVESAGIDIAEAALIAIGHGSRHPQARDRDAAAGLARSLRGAFRSSDALYLEWEPTADSWAAHVAGAPVVVAPVFFSDARHLRRDVPALFGLGDRMPGTIDSMSGPFIIQERTIWYAEMPPSAPCVADLILDLARVDPTLLTDRAPTRGRT